LGGVSIQVLLVLFTIRTVYLYESPHDSVAVRTTPCRYVVLQGSYGQTANLLRAIINLITFAKIWNLTAVTDLKNSQASIANVFDWNGLGDTVDVLLVSDTNEFLKGKKIGYMDGFGFLSGDACRDVDVLVILAKNAYHSCLPQKDVIQVVAKIQFSSVYRHAVKKQLDQMSLNPLGFVGIHHRSPLEFLDNNWFVESVRQNHHRTLMVDAHLVREIMAAHDIENLPVLVSSDGKDKDKDQEFLSAGFQILKPSDSLYSTQAPILDMATMIQAKHFIGTSLSSFSAFIALFRVAHFHENRNTLAWPSLDNGTVEGFERCSQAFFFCGRYGGYC